MISAIKNISVFITILVMVSCDNKEEFAFEIDDLTGTEWGIPQIIEIGPNVFDYDLSAPTVFYADGTMSIGVTNFDFWSIRSSRTILLERAQEIWFVIDLSPTQLMVEKNSYPDNNFLLRCVYYPMGQ